MKKQLKNKKKIRVAQQRAAKGIGVITNFEQHLLRLGEKSIGGADVDGDYVLSPTEKIKYCHHCNRDIECEDCQYYVDPTYLNEYLSGIIDPRD